MHRLYAGFAPALLPLLLKVTLQAAPPPAKPGAPPVVPETDVERTTRLGRKRAAAAAERAVGAGPLAGQQAEGRQCDDAAA